MSDILCIGSVLWDVIGRAPGPMERGADRPGRIERLAGGVALNIAMTLARFGMRPILLSAVGQDAPGAELMAACTAMGLHCDHVHRTPLPTDRYMAIEDENGLVAAIADAHALEAAGQAILAPLSDGRLASAAAPWAGPVALDGNLTPEVLDSVASGPLLAGADLRVASASPGKAQRLAPLLAHDRAVFYMNRTEAELLCGQPFDDAAGAADALLRRGAARAVVTNGASPACDGMADAGPDRLIGLAPPALRPARVTGAGDTFMAAHIAAELAGADRRAALGRAVEAAALHISGAAR